MSNSLDCSTCGLQHTRLPCTSPNSGAYSSSCPWSQWCYPTISSSVIPFSSRLQSFLASGSFPMSQFLASGGQNIGFSTSTSVLPMNQFFTSGSQSIRASASTYILPVNIQHWFPLWLTGFISWDSLPSWGTLKSLLPPRNSKASIIWHSDLSMVQFSHPYMNTGKTTAFTIQTFVSKLMSLLFNMLRSKHLLISWL